MVRKLLIVLCGLGLFSAMSWAQDNVPNDQIADDNVLDAEDDLGFGDGAWKLAVMDKFGLTASKDGVGGEATLTLALFSLDVLGLQEVDDELKERPFPVFGLGYTVGLPKFGEVERYQEVAVDFLLLGLGFGRHYRGSKDVGRQVSVHVYMPYLYPQYPVSLFARSRFEEGEKTHQIFGVTAKVSLSSLFFLD